MQFCKLPNEVDCSCKESCLASHPMSPMRFLVKEGETGNWRSVDKIVAADNSWDWWRVEYSGRTGRLQFWECHRECLDWMLATIKHDYNMELAGYGYGPRLDGVPAS